MKRTILLSAITMTLLSTTFADDNQQLAMNQTDIDAEMDAIFGESTPLYSEGDFEVVELDAPIESVEPLAIETEAVTVREGEFSLSLSENQVHYQLPVSIDEPTIELRSLDGTVLTSIQHSINDISGSIETTELDAGYYIVRILDGAGKSSETAYAIAVN